MTLSSFDNERRLGTYTLLDLSVGLFLSCRADLLASSTELRVLLMRAKAAIFLFLFFLWRQTKCPPIIWPCGGRTLPYESDHCLLNLRDLGRDEWLLV